MDIRPRVAGSTEAVGATVPDLQPVPAPDRAVAGAARGPLPVTSGAGTFSAARARVLRHLQEHAEPVAAEELARKFGQHPNTVRNHLDGLVGEGLVLRERAPVPSRGRPPWRYRLDPDHAEPDSRLREHQGLVIALATQLAERSAEPRAEARSAGQGWGDALVGKRASRAHGQPAGVAHATPAAARREVVRLLADLEFSPRADRDAVRVVLTSCPLLDVARRNPEVVCAVHEGMVAGALAALRGAGGDRGRSSKPDPPSGRDRLERPDDGVRLVPFATAQGCVLTLPRSGAILRAAAPPDGTP